MHRLSRVEPDDDQEAQTSFQAYINGSQTTNMNRTKCLFALFFSSSLKVHKILFGLGAVSVDDVLVYSSCNLDEYIEHIREVITRLKEHGLCVKPEMCKFHVEETEFLGFPRWNANGS